MLAKEDDEDLVLTTKNEVLQSIREKSRRYSNVGNLKLLKQDKHAMLFEMIGDENGEDAITLVKVPFKSRLQAMIK